jgi:serine/threonine protein kinase
LALNSTQIRTLGPYHLLEQVGRGGMATVFKAFHPEQERYVAIKVMSPGMAGEGQFSKRIRREAEVVMRLKHPHIVSVESFGEEDGFVYLVMPLLKVGSLTDRLAKGALTPLEGARIMAQISDALQFAHDQGVVHRDVKPSNILMDETGNALLSDFGLAQIHDASVSLTGSALLGTPAYMSPEQARGETVDARSDQYSLGVILYQLSTGRLPFEADTPMAVLMKHINEPLPPARMNSPNVPPAERAILKAAKMQERFASVGELNHFPGRAISQDRSPPTSALIRHTSIRPAGPSWHGPAAGTAAGGRSGPAAAGAAGLPGHHCRPAGIARTLRQPGRGQLALDCRHERPSADCAGGHH